MTVRTWLGGAVAIAALCGTAVAADVTHFQTNEVTLPSALPDYNALIDKMNAAGVGQNTNGLSGMTATQVPLAATATTITSSFPIAATAKTAIGIAVGSAGGPVVLNGVLGTPSSGTGTNITAIPNNNVLAQTLAAGTSVSLSAPRETYICTGTCTVTPPVPVAGYEFCVMNDDNVTTVITLAALGSAAMYEATARTSYGTAGTGTLVSDGAAANAVCIRGRDATHYLTVSSTGTWTAN